MANFKKYKIFCILTFILCLLAIIGSVICFVVAKNIRSQVHYNPFAELIIGAIFVPILVFSNQPNVFESTGQSTGPSIEDQILMQQEKTCTTVGIVLIFVAFVLFTLGIIFLANYRDYINNDLRGYNSFKKELVKTH